MRAHGVTGFRDKGFSGSERRVFGSALDWISLHALGLRNLDWMQGILHEGDRPALAVQALSLLHTSKLCLLFFCAWVFASPPQTTFLTQVKELVRTASSVPD